MGMECPSEAKADLGRAVVMLLQSGLVDMFKGVPLTSGPDLACFAASIFFSSASIFLLSRLRRRRRSPDGEELVVSVQLDPLSEYMRHPCNEGGKTPSAAAAAAAMIPAAVTVHPTTASPAERR